MKKLPDNVVELRDREIVRYFDQPCLVDVRRTGLTLKRIVGRGDVHFSTNIERPSPIDDPNDGLLKIMDVPRGRRIAVVGGVDYPLEPIVGENKKAIKSSLASGKSVVSHDFGDIKPEPNRNRKNGKKVETRADNSSPSDWWLFDSLNS